MSIKMEERGIETKDFAWKPEAQGLYSPGYEKDNCGVAMVADISGKPTRKTVADCLNILENLEHRGAVGCEPDSGDGAGILTSMPDKFVRKHFKDLPPLRQYAVGNAFFVKNKVDKNDLYDAKRIFEETAQHVEGVKVKEWRVVPVCSHKIGKTAQTFEPHIEQVLVVAEGDCIHDENKFQGALYTLRLTALHAINKRLRKCMYMCSLSSRTITYKGMLTCPQLLQYYPDLQDQDFEGHVAIVHSRFSTNTFPAWDRAHPYRQLAHNGEINTVKANVNAMKSREANISTPFLPDIEELFPLFNEDQTDSSQLDNILELVTIAGRSLTEAALLMVPQAWEKTLSISQELKDFYKVQSSVMGPWDGPACLIYTDANTAGSCLDRNGLRPCRYYVTKDNRVICGSEAGLLHSIQPDEVLTKGRLSPGEIFCIDFHKQKMYLNDEIKYEMAAAQPYGKWITENSFTIADLQAHAVRPSRRLLWAPPRAAVQTSGPLSNQDGDARAGDPSDQGLRAFGYTHEALQMLLMPMAKSAYEAMGSMGNDAPLACLSDLPRPVFDFFYQRFAQVSNPPIDPIREYMVMSLSCYIGPEENLLAPLSPQHCKRLWLEHPCLLPQDMEAIYSINGFRGWTMHVVDSTFPVAEGTHGMHRHLLRVVHEACDAIRFGQCKVVVLSDRGMSRERAAIPSLLCSGAVHQALVKEKLRLQVALIVDSGEPFEVNHHCLMAAFGADGVCPYNAYEAILKLARDKDLEMPAAGPLQFYKNYQYAVGFGMQKVFAKMGVCTLHGYKGAQLAEPLGLHPDVTSMCFTGSVSQVGGLNFDAIAERTLRLHNRGYPHSPMPIDQISNGLFNDGKYHLRQMPGTEIHLNDPMVIAKLQEASRNNSRAAYSAFAAIHNDLVTKCNLRGQLDFRAPAEYMMTPVPLDEVEPASEIVKRFRTGAMSYGSISMGAHATLAIALNKLGGKSNTGEGGEDPLRFKEMEDGSSANSAIKQVASGRFGVSIEYLANAKEIQIKMAQGAKPGEGGELPGWKVEPHIAECRNSTPGVGLVSPPPHHDIYSIEDLAQLIYDLKSANPEAGVSVKLVSEQGVGVVAAGVAKAKADHILISGCEGGTGASKWTGIKSCGASWELGIAETHQTLVLNGLRSRVSLETDGQLRSGRDVVVAAMLGAEHFGFATAPLIAMGCIMMRKCHLNTCPVGIATQDPELMAKFNGLPEHVVNYLMLVAEDCRNIMAKLGFRKLDDMVGRADVLTVNPKTFIETPLSLSKLIAPAFNLPDAGKIGFVESRKIHEQDRSDLLMPESVTAKLIAAFDNTLKTGKPSVHEIKGVKSRERSVGTTLAFHVYKAFGYTLPPASCHAKLEGTSGQSFGAFCGKGVFLELEGDSQDYFGKGLSGALLAVYPHLSSIQAGFKAEDNVIIGNTCLYGAITGAVFIRGQAAERFAVRNSGVWAAVEGLGDHGCEYMTGGRVAVLGKIGMNFGAGMSGGLAWIWDPKGTAHLNINTEMVEVSRMSASEKPPACPHDADDLKELLEAHFRFTGSSVAEGLLQRWPNSLTEFVRVFPTDFRKAIEKSDKGMSNTLDFRSWITLKREMANPAKKAKTENADKAKRSFELPSNDIEDAAGILAARPKIVDPKTIKGNKGFVQFARAEIPKRAVADRSKDFIEIHDHKTDEQIQTQAARCMDCGTPFCHQSVTLRSGCPLGNLIPEWNELVKKGEWFQAFQRLRQTNNFPEFTGRVCPAPCEASCTLGIIDDPVGIKSVELTIVDKAYENGWMDPMPPPSRTGKKVAVIGSGPAGLAAADELNKMGHMVTVFERSCRPGGLMMYGVPNMKTDKTEVVLQRVKIMQAEGVTFICGKAGAVGKEGGPKAQELLDNFDAVLLATGATIGRDLQQVPGRSLRGVHMAMEFLHGNTKALLDNGSVDKSWRNVKESENKTPIDVAGKQVIIIGGGDTGNDCIGTSVRHGAKSINNLELLPQPPPQRAAFTPWPHWPSKHRTDYGHEEAAQMINGGKDIRTFSVQTKEFIGDVAGNVIGLKIVDLAWNHEGGQMKMKEVPGTERTLPCDNVFLALGFLGPEGTLGEQFGVTMERGNFKATFGEKEPKAHRTSNPKVFAAGDCRRGQSLVVWGIKEGRDAAMSIHQYVMGYKKPYKK